MFSDSTRITPSYNTFLLSNLKINFTFSFSIAEIHRFRPINGRSTRVVCSRRARVVPIPSKSGRLEVMLSIKSNSHSPFECRGVNPKDFGSGNASMNIVTWTASGRGSDCIAAMRVSALGHSPLTHSYPDGLIISVNARGKPG